MTPALPNEKVRIEVEGDRMRVGLRGDWDLTEGLLDFEPLVHDSIHRIRRLELDARGLGSWDSSLLAFVWQVHDYCDAHGLDFEADSLPGAVRKLIALTRSPEREVPEKSAPASWIAAFGLWGERVFDEAVHFVHFLGETVLAAAAVVTRRAKFRKRDFWLTLESNSIQALPIVALIAFLVGLILAFLAAVVLRRFAAEYYVSQSVGYGMLRELGALMTGIIMAGRTGAAFAAEIGSMKISQEIDALRTLGISPMAFIVIPRILALFFMMPLLTIYADFIGVLGGWAVVVGMLGISTEQFIAGVLESVGMGDFLLGVGKGTLFGIIIGMAGCMRGMEAEGSSDAVGRAATSAVVTSITLIILGNAVLDWVAALLTD
jgi:phospholipid/cholesterol/gamma-HCH transport system permease protein